jgi:putative transposase
MKKQRIWTAHQKLSIIKEAEQNGVTATIRKHEIYSNTFYSWKEKYELEGFEGLQAHRQRTDPEIKKLRLENERLKQILADKELELSIKGDLLKKTTRNSK